MPVLDNLENAQKHLKDQGLAIAILDFKETLKNEGIVEVEAKVGMEFNEELHEVIEVVEKEEGKKGSIFEVLQNGWKFKDGFLIRAAKVKVYK